MIGTLTTYPMTTFAEATIFELPGGDAVAAAYDSGRILAVRLTRDATGLGMIAESVEVDAPMSLEGAAAISGAPVSDTVWGVAGGGRTRVDTRAAFVTTMEGGTTRLSRMMSGSPDDPPPLVAPTSPPTILRWQQNELDLDDTRLLSFGLSEDRLVPEVRLPTTGLSVPLSAYAGSSGTGAFVVWSQRAFDDLSDTLVHLALFGSDGCGSSEVVRIAQLPGAALASSVHGIDVDGEILLFGLPRGPTGDHEFTMFRVSCTLTPR